MQIPIPTPPAIFHELVTGHFRSGRDYSSWREHGTNDWLMVLTLDGQGRFGHTAKGETITQAGDITLLRPHTYHDYSLAQGAEIWEFLWTHFHPRSLWLDWLRWPEAAPGLMHLTLSEPIVRGKIRARFLETHRLAMSALPHKDLFAMNALEEVLLWCNSQNPRNTRPHADLRVQVVLEYIQEHLSEKLTLEALASQSQLSPSQLLRLFRRQLGTTPNHYVEEQRLLRAQQLLARTSQTISAISAEVGFENPFYFTLRFKKSIGLSPSEWRRHIERTEQRN